MRKVTIWEFLSRAHAQGGEAIGLSVHCCRCLVSRASPSYPKKEGLARETTNNVGRYIKHYHHACTLALQKSVCLTTLLPA